jgi:hypothetical protein
MKDKSAVENRPRWPLVGSAGRFVPAAIASAQTVSAAVSEKRPFWEAETYPEAGSGNDHRIKFSYTWANTR